MRHPHAVAMVSEILVGAALYRRRWETTASTAGRLLVLLTLSLLILSVASDVDSTDGEFLVLLCLSVSSSLYFFFARSLTN